MTLPECFNSPYGTKYFPEYAEEIPNGESFEMLSKAAKENNIFLIGGSIPERSDGKLYNTCCIFNNKGNDSVFTPTQGSKDQNRSVPNGSGLNQTRITKMLKI